MVPANRSFSIILVYFPAGLDSTGTEWKKQHRQKRRGGLRAISVYRLSNSSTEWARCWRADIPHEGEGVQSC